MRRIAGIVAILLSSTAPAAAQAPTKAQLEKQAATLKAKEEAATRRATREVESGRYRDRDLFGPDHKTAIRERTKQLFGRTQRRLAKAVDDAKDFLDQSQPHHAEAVLASWRDNRRMTAERQIPRHVRSFVQRKTGLLRDSRFKPGTPGAGPEAAVWRERAPLSPAEIYGGPWTEKDGSMTLPGRDTVLRLGGLRDLDADGIHPSAVAIDPTTKKEFKIKLSDGYDVSAAAIVGRLVTAMGYHSPQATYLLPEVKVDPRVVIAAYRYQNRIGIRVRDGSVLASLGVTPGKHGYTWLHPDPRQIVGLKRKGVAKPLSAPEAIALLADAAKDGTILDSIEHVTLRNVTAQTEENKGHAVGPWDLDAAPNRDGREIRGYSLIQSWLEGTDVRLSNNQLIVVKENGRQTLWKVFSDAGSSLAANHPETLQPTVHIDKNGRRLHSDSNKIVNRSFDRTTRADAEFGMRLIGSLSRQQIEAAVASGVSSYPLLRFYTARLIERRNDMVKKLGMEKELGLMSVPKLTEVSGGGEVALAGPNGPQTIHLDEGRYRVAGGQLVPVP